MTQTLQWTLGASLLVLALVTSARIASGQTPNTGAPSTTQPAAPETPPADAPATPPSNYTYSVDGRRDPFLSLVNRGTTDLGPTTGAHRPDGVQGLLVNELVVRGILRSQGGWIAMVGAPNGKTYTVRAGDRLMDGTVRSINAQALILMQEVNDPLSLEKQREVRKFLRGGEEVQ